MNLLKKFPFKDKPDTIAITCVHILEENKPILYVSHDLDDGYWQFLCGKEHNIEDSKVVGLEEIYKMDKSIKKLANLDCGKFAYRKDPKSKWNIR